MPRALSRDDVVALHVLNANDQSNVQIGRALGVTAGTGRYRSKWRAERKLDGRGN